MLLNNNKLLVASHIVPWSQNTKHRLNPKNGLCLCSIHDKAFDSGLISFNDNLTMLLSTEIKNTNNQASKIYFEQFENTELHLPKKFYPSIEFLKFHRQNIFI